MSHIPQIDIGRSRRSRHFGGSERLWQGDLDRLIQMIQEHVQELEDFLNDDASAGPQGADRLAGAPNLSLAVFGPAGSGKSSFLKTLVAETKRACRDPKNGDPRLRRVASLDILQPARFGEGDHLLYATVAAGLDAHHQQTDGDLDYEVLTPVLKAYRDLSGDLRVLYKEHSVADLEPHALAAEVIQRHTSGLRLGKRIDNFIEALAGDLNCGVKSRDRSSSVVLLPVDDLDLSPRHLLAGLRELQAYLLHPRLIPVFCFTDRLAEEILAGEFANVVTHADQSRKKTGRLSVSEQLAVQYLSKCFPIRNRVRLGPTPATLQGGNLRGRGRKHGEEPVMWTLITASTLLFGVPDRNARHPVRSALRPTTLRRQFHVIDAMRQVEVDSLISRHVITLLRPAIGPADADEPPRVPAEPWGVLFDRAAWALLNVHRDVLREYGMHLEDLYSWAPHGLRRVLLDSLFQQSGRTQIGLWQRWSSLSDSRRSQIISLLAANAYRPWLEGERPSGEDLPQIAISRADQDRSNNQWCDCRAECQRREDLTENRTPGDRRCKVEHQILAGPVALQWFLDLALGFYLPLGRSVYRHLRADDSYTKQPLSGAGWSFHTAPIHAAQAAHDDQKLFPAGMMFLDTFSYATALTTAPRIAACRELDSGSVRDDQWEFIKRTKVFFLSTQTKAIVKLHPEGSSGDEETDALWQALLQDAEGQNLVTKLRKAQEVFEAVASWESGRKKSLATDAEESRLYKKIEEIKEKDPLFQGDSPPRHPLEKSLLKHDYETSLELVKNLPHTEDDERARFRHHVRGLQAAANAVHDDQLFLRIWTCYGYNRGRFWAAVSLWRGLGLMGQLIEAHRRWRVEYLGRAGLRPGAASRSDAKDQQELLNSQAYRHWVTEKITGLLHTHSLRGLVPGKDLGEPTHKGTLELAFSGWNTQGQRQAIWRMAHRLRSWLDHNWDLDLSPGQEGGKPRWGGCFVRRMHGGYFVGSLWQWLDAEFLEHQGKQYGQRRSYYWNAGVALTSWFRVLQRYFGGLHELRWMLETCPLMGPFLARSPTDPFLAKLREEPYAEMLVSVALDGEAVAEASETTGEDGEIVDRESVPGYRKMRSATRFRKTTQELQRLWMGANSLSSIKELCGEPDNPVKELKEALKAINALRDNQPPGPQDTSLWRELILKMIGLLDQEPDVSKWRSGLMLKRSTWVRIVTNIRKAENFIKQNKTGELDESIKELHTLFKKTNTEVTLLMDSEDIRVSVLNLAMDELNDAIKNNMSSAPLSRRYWNAIAEHILESLVTGPGLQNNSFFSGLGSHITRLVEVNRHIREKVGSHDPDQPSGGYSEKSYKESLLSTFRPRVTERASSPRGNRSDSGDEHDLIDSTSACFEIASMIQQHWKVTAHASASSLFYQIPRVRRMDFFNGDKSTQVDVDVSGRLAVEDITNTPENPTPGPAGESQGPNAGSSEDAT